MQKNKQYLKIAKFPDENKNIAANYCLFGRPM